MNSLSSAGSRTGSRRRIAPALAILCLFSLLVAAVPAARAGKVQETYPPTGSTDCQRCNVQAIFAEKMRMAGALIDFINLRDGVGVVYSAADPHEVGRIQRAAEWASTELQRIADDPGAYHLCSYCKATRGIYRKVDREVVRTAQGAIFFMRSSDPEAVRALKDMLLKKPKAEIATPAPSR